MKFIYKYAILPKDDVLSAKLDNAANNLYKKLYGLNVQDLKVSDYTKRYLEDHKKKLIYSLQVYTYMLFWSVKLSNKSLSDLSILENGGGTGILCLLAKEVGVKNIIYNDVYDVACNDFKELSKYFDLEPDHIILGEIEEIAIYLNQNQINCDVIASRNVIEHIYDLNNYFHKASTIQNKDLILFLATTANEKNILTDIYTKRIHNRSEYQDRERKWGFKQRDSYNAYCDIRKSIISESYKNLTSKEVDLLAKLTRGLIKEDIILAVNEYVKNGKRPDPIKHPTNTCDPMTGNWAEHLVSLTDYKKLIEKNDFSLNIICGFYNTHYKLKILNIITSIANMVIKKLTFTSIYGAPFIVLYCKKKNHSISSKST